MNAHIPDKVQNATKAIISIQRDEWDPIKIAPINPKTIEIIEKNSQSRS